MVALTLVLLGASFFSLTYSYIVSEKRGELQDKAEVIAQMAVSAYSKPGILNSPWSEDLKEIVSVAKRMSNTDFLIWIPSLRGFISTDGSIGNRELTLPAEMGEKLEKASITLSIKAGDNGKAFGSVSGKEISKAIQDQLNLEIDKKKLVLPEPLKTFGTHEVPVKLHKDVTAKLSVKVTEA